MRDPTPSSSHERPGPGGRQSTGRWTRARTGAALTEKEVREFAARRLADFKLFRSRSRVARHVMADHVKCYKRALLEAGLKPTTPWRLVKKYCRAVGIDLDRPGSRGIGIHSLRFVRKEEDAEVAARRIHIRVTGRKGE